MFPYALTIKISSFAITVVDNASEMSKGFWCAYVCVCEHIAYMTDNNSQAFD